MQILVNGIRPYFDRLNESLVDSLSRTDTTSQACSPDLSGSGRQTMTAFTMPSIGTG